MLKGKNFASTSLAHVILERDEEYLTLVNVSDRSVRRRRRVPGLDATLESGPIILLNHQAGKAKRTAALGVALQLSGHTHGGLIVGIDRLAARANAGFVSGAYEVDGMTLHVNNRVVARLCRAAWPCIRADTDHPSTCGSGVTTFPMRHAEPVLQNTSEVFR